MKQTTHALSEAQKKEIFNRHNKLISMIYHINCMGLRKQIKKLYHILTGTDETDIDFMIAELIQKGFLINHKISSTRTTMLYLTKWPRSQFEADKESRNVQALTFSMNKILKHIFTVDYMIEKVIPDMKNQDFEISIQNIRLYFEWIGTNLLLSCSQYDNALFYNRFLLACNSVERILSYDFYRDREIADYEKEFFRATHSKTGPALPPCRAKIQRDTEKDSYTSEIERQKNYFSLNNLAGQGFLFEGFYRKNPDIINLAYFDFNNSLQTKKLYQRLGYMLLMFNRYLNSNDIRLHVTVWVWDEERKNHLQEDSLKQAYDFYRQEMATENKADNILKNIGILPCYWENIKVNYRTNNLYEKYNISQNK